MVELGPFLEREQGRVERALSGLVESSLAGIDPGLREPMEYALTSSGKRLRPILCVAAYRAAAGPRDPGDDLEPALYRLACALEIVHTYSLVHDDLPCMDDDDLRRGRPTAHRVYGYARAVAAGAALLPLAVEVLLSEGARLGLDEAERAALVGELCASAGAEGMVGGQWLDLAGEQREIGAEELEAIHRAKTGALLTAALLVGARAARAGAERLAAFAAYGRALGLAFQITDDVLDVVGDAEQLGKTAGRDQQLRKASYPSLYGLEGAREMARARAAEARAALQGIHAPELLALADFVVERSR